MVDGVPGCHQLQVISLVPCAPLSTYPDLRTLTPTGAYVLPLGTHRLPFTHTADQPPPTHTLPHLRAAWALDRRIALRLLCEWLSWADTLVGMNLPFDLAYLRHHHPALRVLLNGRHTLIDLSYINFLESDVRPERSLKTLGPVLSTHTYDAGTTARDHRFKSFASLAHYCAQDSWNTVLAIRELAARITESPSCSSPSSNTPSASSSDFSSSTGSSPPSKTSPTTSVPGSSPMGGDKLSPFSIALNSDTLWDCIEMSDHGVPYSISALEHLAATQLTEITAAELAAAPDLLLSGPGSAASKAALLNAAITEIGPTILDNPLLQFTEKRRSLSFSDSNRALLKSRLAPHSPLRALFDAADRHAAATKLLSSYLYPLLWHRRNNPAHRTSLLVPQKGHSWSPRNPPPPSPLPKPPASTTSSPAPKTNASE